MNTEGMPYEQNVSSSEALAKLRKGALVTLLLALGIAFFAFDLSQYLSLSYLKGQREVLGSYYKANPVSTAVVYFLIYVVAAALSFPGAAILTLAGGAIFGLALGTFLASFASSIGAILAFFASRYLLRGFVQKKFPEQCRVINRGVEREGATYLFTLRLIPVIPFFVINLLMGLTPMRALLFFAVSQLGMLPTTIAFVNAGTQLGHLESPADALSSRTILAFVLLGLIPFLGKRLMVMIKGPVK